MFGQTRCTRLYVPKIQNTVHQIRNTVPQIQKQYLKYQIDNSKYRTSCNSPLGAGMASCISNCVFRIWDTALELGWLHGKKKAARPLEYALKMHSNNKIQDSKLKIQFPQIQITLF